MKKPLLIAIVALAAVLVIGGLYFGGGTQKSTVRVGYLPITACLPYFVGSEMGYFAEEGLTVESIRLESSQQMMDALIQGKIDMITSVATTVALLVEEKSPNQFKVLGVNTNGTENPLNVLLVKKDSPIQSVADLSGKKIGSFPGIQATTFLKKYLRENGNPMDVIVQEMKQELHLQALDSGQIDAVLTYEPNATIAEKKGLGRALVVEPISRASVDPYPTGMFLITQSMLQKNPSLAEKMIRIFTKSRNYIGEHPDVARTLLTKAFPIEPDIAASVPLPGFDTVETLDRASLQRFADILYSEGVLTKQPNIENILFQ